MTPQFPSAQLSPDLLDGPLHEAAKELPLPQTVWETQDLAWCHVTQNLPCDERAPRQARAYVSTSLSDWHVPDDITDVLVQVVSELVTNSMRHTESAMVGITVALSEKLAWVGVTNQAGTTQAHVRAPSAADESGRGLLLVDALTTWWSTTTAHGQTDVVAAVALDGASWTADVRGAEHGDVAGVPS